MRTIRWTLMLAAGVSHAALRAQDPPPAPSVAQPPAQTDTVDPAGTAGDTGEGDVEEIVVTGRAPPGAVPGDIKPELQLSPADIRAYGASSVAELLTELGPQVQSSRGRDGGQPVVLVNGRRTAGFQEIRDLPTEAILRVDILPEEVALRYGYRADQRVVNFVLRPRFRSYTGEAEARAPTGGGSSGFELEGGLVRIDRDRRLNVNLQAETESNLLESERDILPNTAGRPFDLVGNVTAPVTGAEIDPALSALAGAPVTVAAVPAGGRTLADFAQGANAPRIADTTPFRTLRPARDRYSGNAVYSRTIFGNVAATATARLEHSRTEALLGLPGVALSLPGASPFSPFAGEVQVLRYAEAVPLVRDGRTTTANGTVAFNGDVGRWRWSLNGSYDRTETDTDTDRGVDAVATQAAVRAGTLDPFGALGPFNRLRDTARSVATAGAVDALASGSLFSLPAGEANANVRVLARTTDFTSRSVRAGVQRDTEIGRDAGTLRANIDLPIANAARGTLSGLGRLSLNGNAEVERLSDFGTLTALGYGFNWQPITQVRLLVSVTHEEGAPTPQQLGNPVIATPFTRVFDFVRGETVDITQIDGGNTALGADNRRVVKAGLNVRPLTDTDLSFTADYVSSRIDDPIAAFPAVTAEVAAAFPERFLRDADGRLLQVDNRPVNFARSDRSEIRWGVNFSKPVTTERQRRFQAERAARQAEREAARTAAGGADEGAAREGGPPPPGGADRARDTARGSGGPGGPGRGFGGPGGRGGFGGGGGGRLQASLYHTWRLTDTVLIRQGLPELDLLDGSAIGNRGGNPRHALEFRGGYTRDGLGMRLNADWRAATRVDGAATGGDSLRFGDLTTVGLRLFADLGQQPALVRDRPWLRGTRVTLAVDNLFNQRQRVTNQEGVVPFGFQPGFIDPLGRSIRLNVRKLLF